MPVPKTASLSSVPQATGSGSVDVTVVGSTNADVTATVPRLPGKGETLLGTSLVTSPGGKGANQALAASRAGATVRFIGAVGDDDAASTALSYLRSDGVDLSAVLTRQDVPTGTALIWVEDSAENSIVVIPGANGSLTAQDVDRVADDGGLEGVVVLQGEIPAETVARAAQRAPGRLVVNLAPVIDVPVHVLLKADPLIVNEHEGVEALRILGGEPSGSGETAVVGALLAAGVHSVVMTLGARGAIVGDPSGLRAVAAAHVKAVDTTGAGDAFVGAAAARLAHGAGLDAAVSYAARFAAGAVLSAGTQSSYPQRGASLPTLDEEGATC
ncbi:ribokinase [Kocuria sp.]|uniref:ribokinase n=1 Tax=Kocuria sp. TaxID=1871328 RepID=UPI0028AB7E1D|nr:ribokinase [Kocuria sp.]